MTKQFEEAFKECCEVSIDTMENNQRTDITISLVSEGKLGKILTAKGITRKSANKFKLKMEEYLSELMNTVSDRVENILKKYTGMKITSIVIEELEIAIRNMLNEYAQEKGYNGYPDMFAKEFLAHTKIMTVHTREKNIKNYATEDLV